MKKIILILAIAISVVACKVDSKNKTEVSEVEHVTVSDESSALTVDSQNSLVEWKGFKPTGSHNGTISIYEGVLNISSDVLIGGRFTIDMNSIVNLDVEDIVYKTKLVAHLKSEDFFDVESFPKVKFEITKVNEVEGKLNISGNLTAKGITKNITIPATLTKQDGVVTLRSDPFKIDRTEFGIQYNSDKFFENLKDKSIDDLFELSFVVLTNK